MANSATRRGGKIIVHCDACGSEGHSPATKLTKVPNPEAEAARAVYLTKVRGVRDSNDRQWTALVAKAKGGADINADAEALRADTSAKLTELAATNPKEVVSYRLASCPWCGAALGVDVDDPDAPVAEAAKRDPLDHDGDGKKGGSLPKAQRVGRPGASP